MDFMSSGRIGTTDRIIRSIGGAVAVAVAFLWVSGVWQIVLWVVGGSLLLEGIFGFCPMTYWRRRSVNKKGT